MNSAMGTSVGALLHMAIINHIPPTHWHRRTLSRFLHLSVDWCPGEIRRTKNRSFLTSPQQTLPQSCQLSLELRDHRICLTIPRKCKCHFGKGTIPSPLFILFSKPPLSSVRHTPTPRERTVWVSLSWGAFGERDHMYLLLSVIHSMFFMSLTMGNQMDNIAPALGVPGLRRPHNSTECKLCIRYFTSLWPNTAEA